MPLPMVHLSVAHGLIEDHGYPDCPDFYLGSIVPDAIHMRPGTNGQDKRTVHLRGENGLDLDRLRALLGDGDEERSEEARAFLLGYAAHVLTDVLWREETILPFRKRFVGHISYPELRTLYYDECDKLDLDLYDEQPWRPQVWEALRIAPARDVSLAGVRLLSASEVDAWRTRTLGWFDAHREKAAYQPQQITRDLVWPFIPRAAAHVAATLLNRQGAKSPRPRKRTQSLCQACET